MKSYARHRYEPEFRSGPRLRAAQPVRADEPGSPFLWVLSFGEAKERSEHAPTCFSRRATPGTDREQTSLVAYRKNPATRFARITASHSIIVKAMLLTKPRPSK